MKDISTALAKAREAALDEAVAAVEAHDRRGRDWVPGSLWDNITLDAAARIRALRGTPAAAVAEDVQRARLIASEAQALADDAAYLGKKIYVNDLVWALKILAAPQPSSNPGPLAAVEELTDAARDVLAERHRQAFREGYTHDHDDEHVNDEIAALACFYAMPLGARDWDATSTGYGATLGEAILPPDWHTSTGDRRRELVKAGALVIAELERLDRAASMEGAHE